ncbi:hypothetical protein RND71_028438 [Anisodus tanguticus]|uniref:G-box binding protein multifunctional mosaic region domain-containing protein n=1 Tax=Anisodus tanguticus TaxID=243964 RepID=A0AAE1RJT3_9SOLA|nr:hypothetical protein RND71_028438 [Anisodus tanguticus]
MSSSITIFELTMVNIGSIWTRLGVLRVRAASMFSRQERKIKVYFYRRLLYFCKIPCTTSMLVSSTQFSLVIPEFSSFSPAMVELYDCFEVKKARGLFLSLKKPLLLWKLLSVTYSGSGDSLQDRIDQEPDPPKMHYFSSIRHALDDILGESEQPSLYDQSNIHVYPDWAARQAYYGPRLVVPLYVNSVVAPGHAPHPYMWGPLQSTAQLLVRR